MEEESKGGDVDSAPRKETRLLFGSTVKRKWALALAVAISSACFLIVGFSLLGSKESSSDLPVTSIDPRRRRYIMFRTALARLTEPASFVNPNSAQTLALKWLAYQDQMISIPEDTETVAKDSPLEWKLAQRYALMVFSFSTNGEAWRTVAPWEEHVNVDECSVDFEGVRCDEASGHVTTIRLINEQIGGRIPKELGLLTQLTHMEFLRNRLEGHIPQSLYSKLSNLEFLELSDNDIAFPLHEDIGNLSNLKALHLSNTFVSGTLPQTMAKLTGLRQLLIANNRLQGSLLHFLDSWRHLETLHSEESEGLVGTIPTEIGYLSELKHLTLRATQADGSIPTEVGKLTQLSTFVVGGYFEGTLPSEIGQCTELTRMVVSPAGGMRGSLPSTIENLSYLELLVISDTSIGERIPSELGKLTKLDNLILNANLFGGALPSELANLKNLSALQVHANELSGTILKEVCDLPAAVLIDCTEELVCEDDCCPKGWCAS